MRFIIAVTLALFASGVRAETLLRFCYDPYPPFTIQEEGKLVGGLKVVVLEEVVAMIDGVDAEVHLLPWKRCQEAVRAKEFDGILPLFPNSDRRQYMTFSDPVFMEQSVFFYARAQHPEGIDWSGNAEELSNLRLGMLRGSYIDETVEASFQERGAIQRADSVHALLLMLNTARVDLVGTDVNVGRYVAAQSGLGDQISWVKRPIAQKTSHFGLSKLTGADQHIPAFNAALDVLRSSGRLDAILDEAGQ